MDALNRNIKRYKNHKTRGWDKISTDFIRTVDYSS